MMNLHKSLSYACVKLLVLQFVRIAVTMKDVVLNSYNVDGKSTGFGTVNAGMSPVRRGTGWICTDTIF